MLKEDKRKQLDNIVTKMVTNNEPDDVIQFVVNDFKAKYDTPEPVKNTGIVQGAKDVVVGAGKGLLNTALGISSLGSKALQTLMPSDELGRRGDKTTAEFIKDSGVSTPTNKAQKLGFMGEQIAEFFIPGGASLKAGNIASKAVKGGNIIKGATKLAATGATEGILGAGQTAFQEGAINKNVKTTGLVSTVMPAGFSALGKTLKGAGKVAGEFAGKFTGAGGDAVFQAFKNPNVIKFAREAGKDLDGFQNEVLSETKSALTLLAEKRATQYQKQLSKIKLNKTELDDITFTVRDKAVSLMDNFDVSFANDESGKLLNQLDFSKSTLIEGQPVVQKALNDVMSWIDNTPAGLDKLKRRMGAYADQLSSREKRQALSIVLDLKSTIDDGLKKNVKGYEQLTSGYREASITIDDINKTFSIGNNKAKETQLKKILGSLRDNNENRRELLEVLGQTGNKDLVGKVAGTQLSKITPKGLSGVIGPATGLGASIINPANIPMVMSYMALSSPRLVGELANILGNVNNQMIKANKFSPQIQRAIRELMLKNSSTHQKNTVESQSQSTRPKGFDLKSPYNLN